MRTFVLAIVAAMAATSATAMDLPVPGLALNTDVVAQHKVDAEATTLTITPELEWQPMVDGPLSLTADTYTPVLAKSSAKAEVVRPKNKPNANIIFLILLFPLFLFATWQTQYLLIMNNYF